MENQENKVRVENLTKYFGDLHVLDGVSFNIRKGEFLCVVGPTGCGKTTFLNLLTRIYMPIIGRAFALQPDLLLMDEPYGQMDIKLRFYLEDEVIRLWKETGTTVVFITHNIEEAVYLAERVLILTNKPAKIKEEVMVDLPRPRKVSDPAFIKIRNHITDQIKWW